MLSPQEKEKMKEHFRSRDLYDPSQAPEQKPIDFQPKMACGGEVGYSNGGESGGVLGELGSEIGQYLPDIAGAVQKYGPTVMNSMNGGMGFIGEGLGKLGKGMLAGATGTTDQMNGLITDKQAKQMASDQLASKQPLRDAVNSPTMPAKPSLPLPVASAPQNAPQAVQGGPSGLSPDQMEEMVRFMSQKPSLGQSAMSGLGGLADAIMMGVARSGSPGFQKNINEQNQLQKTNLAEALKSKYDMGFKNKSLNAENTRAANNISAENERARLERNMQQRGQEVTEATRAAELSEKAKENQVQSAEAAAKLPPTGMFHPSTWGQHGKDIETVRNQLLNNAKNIGGGQTVRIKDSKGVLHDIPTANLSKAKQRDPGIQVIQ